MPYYFVAGALRVGEGPVDNRKQLSTGSQEKSEYNRDNRMSGPYWSNIRKIGTFWHVGQDVSMPWPPNPWPKVRMRAKRNPADAWTIFGTFLEAPNNWYFFEFELDDGHWWLEPEIEGGGYYVLGQGLVVNTSGAPLPVQKPWDGIHRFEVSHGIPFQPGKQFDLTNWKEPQIIKRKARKYESYGGKLLPHTEQWAERLVNNHGHNAVTRSVGMVPTGDLAIDAKLNYYYHDIVRTGANAPRRIARSGTAPLAATPCLWSMEPSPSSTGWYCSDLMSGVYFINRQQRRLIQLAGWDVAAGKHVGHGGLVDNGQYPYFESTHTYVGDWSQVRGSKRFNEVWGMACVRDAREPAGFHEGICCDTLNDRFLNWNHWTAHPAGGHFEPPAVKAYGYVPSTAPHGKPELYTMFDASTPGVTPEMVAKPFDIVWNPFDGRFYATIYQSGCVIRFGIDGKPPEIFAKTAVNPTDAQLGYSGWLNQGASEATLRPQFVKDGGPATAVFVRPQGITVLSTGHVVWACRYTFVLCIAHPDRPGHVSTFAHLPGNYGNSFGATDVKVNADPTGAVGPKDAVRTLGFNDKDFLFTSTGDFKGNFVGRIMQTGEPRASIGQFDRIEGPLYPWGMGIDPIGILAIAGTVSEQVIEVSKKQSTDVPIDFNRYNVGEQTWKQKLILPYGPNGQNAAGFKSIDELGALTDAGLKTEFAPHGVTDAELPNVVYVVRALTQGNDYSGVVVEPAPHPTAPPPPPIPTPPPTPMPIPTPPPPPPSAWVVGGRVQAKTNVSVRTWGSADAVVIGVKAVGSWGTITHVYNAWLTVRWDDGLYGTSEVAGFIRGVSPPTPSPSPVPPPVPVPTPPPPPPPPVPPEPTELEKIKGELIQARASLAASQARELVLLGKINNAKTALS